MRILIIVFLAIFLNANDLTIEVKKKTDTLPTLAIEDSSTSYNDNFKMAFFKACMLI